MRKSLIILGLWVFGCLGSSPAASYYVDYVAGSDANNGTATGTPFQRCPGDSSATGTAASTTLSSGDTVYFKGGVSYVVSGSGGTGINLNWSGTAGNPITYDGNSSGAWGTGRAIITDNHAASGHYGFYTGTTRSNLMFRSLIIKEMGGAATLPADGGSAVAANNGWGIIFNQGTAAHNVTIRDCDFAELGYYFNAKPMDASSIDGAGIRFYNGIGILVTNCNFSRVARSAGFYANASGTHSNITVTGCDFSDSIIWCIDIASAGANTHTDHITIRSNSFHDYFQLDSGAWTGYGEWPHTDGIFFRQDYTGATYGTNNNFHGNSFYSTSSTGGGTADIYLTEGSNANIYNNTWRYSGKGLALIYFYNTFVPSNPQVVNIFNNSFITTYLPCINISGPGFNNLTMLVKNNIFYDTMTGSGNNFCFYINTTNVLSGVAFDYNTYKTFNTGGYFGRWNDGAGYLNLAGMRSIGWETNGIADDPDYVTLSDNTAPLSANLALQASSPCIGTGVNLATYFTTDMNGVTRGSVWDMGAVEYGTNSPAAGITTLRVNRLIKR